jgi:2,4-dienoyl-CoA reductase-like NADH-dependent reductase (Old Yellow Enzyme family)
VTEALVAYHEARARGGVGSVFTETCTVHPSSPGPLVAWRDDVVPGLALLADRLHTLDTCVFAQLWHGGIQAFPRDGSPAWAPSRLADPIHGRIAQPMTQAMIDAVVEGFAAAAARAERAGLDGVEVHGAHSYLVHSFLSPLTNRRDDAYGADRIRFAREVLAAIRASTSPSFAVGIRIVGSEGVEGGIEPPEAVRILAALEDDGLVDFVDVSMGGYHALGKLIGAMHEPLGYELPTSEPVTRGARVPTIVTGRVTTLAQAEAILAAGVADLVSMVRATIADPALVATSLAGRPEAVRPCIGCNEGCVGRLFDLRPGGGRTGCSVNPDVGREGEPPPAPAAVPRRVLVVGAGPAGLEAAWTAARRGHEVAIHEAAEAPGGLLRVQRRAPHRDEIGRISDWLWDEVGRLGVERRLGSRVDAGLAREFDAVIVATGSLPRRDGVQRLRPAQTVVGIERAVTPLEVLAGEVPAPRTALVFDDCGNYEAVGAAELLLEEGADVCLATSFDAVAPDLFRSFQHGALVARLGGYPGFRAVTRAVLERIEPGRVTLRSLDGGAPVEVDAELAVVMTGFEPQTALVDELLAAGLEVHPAGDVVAPLLLPHAIASGRAAGLAV